MLGEFDIFRTDCVPSMRYGKKVLVSADKRAEELCRGHDFAGDDDRLKTLTLIDEHLFEELRENPAVH